MNVFQIVNEWIALANEGASSSLSSASSSASFSTVLPSVLTSPIFWEALVAIFTVAYVYYLYIQIKQTSKVSAYELLRREMDKFDSTEYRQVRSNLARNLLLYKGHFKLYEEYADELLDYFEDFGLMLRSGLVRQYAVWSIPSYWIIPYWEVLQDYIQAYRTERGSQEYYGEFQHLNEIASAQVSKKEGFAEIQRETSQANLKRFLMEELQVRYGPVESAQIDRVTEVEVSSFLAADAYSREKFLEYFRDHKDGFFVAEILGKVVGYTIGYIDERGIGEVDSIAVDSPYRRLGIGKRLLEIIQEYFKSKSAKECILIVRDGNEPALALYKNEGFQFDNTAPEQHDEISSSHTMRRVVP